MSGWDEPIAYYDHPTLGRLPIVDDVTAETADFHVCLPLSKLEEPYVPSTLARCVVCQQLVWRSRSAPILPRSICPECVVEHVKSRGSG